MALEAGTKLGPYEILSPLGAGGMGETHGDRSRSHFDRVGRSDRITDRGSIDGNTVAFPRFVIIDSLGDSACFDGPLPA